MASCHKEDTIPSDPPVVAKPIFEKVWSTRIYDAPKENVGSSNAYLYKDMYVVTGNGYNIPDPKLYIFDTKTGIKKFEIKQTGKYQVPGYNLIGKDKIVVISDAKGIAAYDIESRSLLWEEVHTDKNELGLVGQLPIYGNHVYKGISIGSFDGPAKMIRYNLFSGEKDELITIPINDKWSPQFSPPTFFVNEKKDTIMLFIDSKNNVNFGPLSSPTDLIAYNITKKRMQWTIKNVMEVGTNTLSPPVVFENTVIFGGDWSIYSVDILTGKVKWRKEFLELAKVGNFNSTGLLLVNDKVFANPDVFDIFCLNAKDGSTIWHKKDAPNCSPKMLHNDGMLITSSFGLGSVLIYDLENGNLIHKEKSSNNYNIDVLYDAESNMYFVQDFAQAVGFKINK